METKTFIHKRFSKYLIFNLLAMLIVVVLVAVALSFGSAIYTQHGKEISVPEVLNKRFEDAEKIMETAGLQIAVSDTGYNRLLPPGCILHQTPAAGQKVKNGRIIYVSINSSKKPTLVVPDIIDNSSLREATARLKILGFKVGEPRMIAGEKDWVYGILCRGKSLAVGDHVPLDAMVVLQVGNGAYDGGDDFGFLDPDIEAADDGIVLSSDSTHTQAAPVHVEDPFQIVEE